jgi:hypothetical protein
MRRYISWSQSRAEAADRSMLPAFQAGHAGSIPVARSASGEGCLRGLSFPAPRPCAGIVVSALGCAMVRRDMSNPAEDATGIR